MSELETTEVSTSDPQPEAPPVPFEPASRQKLGGRGCAWMAGIGCGVVILAGLALIAALAFNGDRLLAWSLTQFEEQILVEVPAGVEEAELEALTRAFSGARERIRAGKANPQALQSFQSIMFEMAFKPPGDRTAEDYRRLQEALERLAQSEQDPEIDGAVSSVAESVGHSLPRRGSVRGAGGGPRLPTRVATLASGSVATLCATRSAARTRP